MTTDQMGKSTTAKSEIRVQNKDGNVKDTGWFINEFKNRVLDENNWSVKKIAEELNQYLANDFFAPEDIRVKDMLTQQVQSEGGTNITFNRTGVTVNYS